MRQDALRNVHTFSTKMIVRSLRLWPQNFPCKAVGCLPTVFDMPLIERIPVFDDAGVDYAADLAPTEGLLLLVVTYAVWRSFGLPVLIALMRR